MTDQQDSTPVESTAAPKAPLTPKEKRHRRAFALAALAGLLSGDPGMPVRIAVRHAWAAGSAMLEADPERGQ
jgi:hypothetical protein